MGPVRIKNDCAQTISLSDGGELVYQPHLYASDRADALYRSLRFETTWERHPPKPRLLYWAGDFDYRYSGITHRRAPWTPMLSALRSDVERSCFGNSQGQFQGVLMNFYRNGSDSVAWHADNERMIRTDSPIASLSFGQPRLFVLRHQSNRAQPVYEFLLEHGSCLIMRGTTQRFWEHCVPKQADVSQGRINLTFRQYQF